MLKTEIADKWGSLFLVKWSAEIWSQVSLFHVNGIIRVIECHM